MNKSKIEDGQPEEKLNNEQKDDNKQVSPSNANAMLPAAIPVRVQRKRVKGWKMPENTIYVGRPGKFGNPYKVGDKNDMGEDVTMEMALEYYEFYLKRKYKEYLPEFLKPLKGKNLACFCPLDKPCHADVLLRLANG
jgi:hypothetical protein